MSPFRLTPRFVERVWGRESLAPWFPPVPGKIGEVWYDTQGVAQDEPFLGSASASHTSSCCSLLVKFLFTTERLSVQVHPDDDFARKHHQCAGKTEMWHILEAEPGATIALGFREPVTREQMKQAALDGSIEELLHWEPVQPGQSFFLTPGVVHAIGPGITICEIQQYSDLTYRLYDYGRPRELHLEKGAEVSHLGQFAAPPMPDPSPMGGELLASCDHFTVDRFSLDSAQQFEADKERYHLLVAVGGSGLINGERFVAGETWMIPANAYPFTIDPVGSATFVRARQG